MRKKEYRNILWEKKYRDVIFFDSSKTFDGKSTGKFEGLLIIYRFLILKYANKKRFMIEPDYVEFGGKNKKEMLGDLSKRVAGIKEWDTKGKHWSQADFFPKEVNEQLLKFKLKEYVKKIS